MMAKQLAKQDETALLRVLKSRFEKNMHRHQRLLWTEVQAKLNEQPEKLWSLSKMEASGGEPDVTGYDRASDHYFFVDYARESPKGRRSLRYDREALETRKTHKPKNSAVDLASSMGIALLTEEQYRQLQELEPFDTKTSSWVTTPKEVRALGGAVFCDFRYGRVFTYHNGAESYYAARGFRGMLTV